VGLSLAPPVIIMDEPPGRHRLQAESSLPLSESAASRAHRELDRLMDGYAAGNTSAFRELYRELAPRLRMFLLRLSDKARLADDLVQETFLRIHRARGSFAKGAAVLPWCYAIARNTYIDHVRKIRGIEPASIDDLAEPLRPVADHRLPDADLAAQETLDIVRTTLAGLPVKHREAFILLRFEELTIAEAARVLDISEANVKVRAFRAYEAFRLALKRSESP
jgi:RNA polymerase sigma-70 factor (ECF subfamily)